jgi:hypothetical protein
MPDRTPDARDRMPPTPTKPPTPNRMPPRPNRAHLMISEEERELDRDRRLSVIEKAKTYSTTRRHNSLAYDVTHEMTLTIHIIGGLFSTCTVPLAVLTLYARYQLSVIMPEKTPPMPDRMPSAPNRMPPRSMERFLCPIKCPIECHPGPIERP